jgi:hypothetical protein
MRQRVWCWTFAFLLISLLCQAQKLPSRLTNQDVIDLVSLGFSDDVIIDKIHASQNAEFETSVSALRTLKAAKVSDAVIRAMINARAAVTPPSNALATPLKSELSKEVGVYVVLSGIMTELQPEIVNWQTGGFVKTHALHRERRCQRKDSRASERDPATGAG